MASPNDHNELIAESINQIEGFRHTSADITVLEPLILLMQVVWVD
jgi:hypothetical protein